MPLTFEIKDTVAWPVLNRPKKINALGPAVYEELDHVLAKIESDRDVRALVITGNEKAFAAGADIAHMAGGTIRDACEFTDQSMRVQMEKDLFCMLFGTSDQKEGMSAFMEKRSPKFKNA